MASEEAPPSSVPESDQRFLANQLRQLSPAGLLLLYRLVCDQFPEALSVAVNPGGTSGSFTVDVRRLSGHGYRVVEDLACAALGGDDEPVQPVRRRAPGASLRTNGPRVKRLKDADVNVVFHEVVPATLLSLSVNTKRPWVCKFPGCNKAFTSKGDVVTHSATHVRVDHNSNGKDLYVRDQTQDKYFQFQGVPVVLLARDKPDEYPWVCKFEGCTHKDGFRSLDKIEKHVSAHVNRKTMCQVCYRKFYSFEALEAHELRAHPVVAERNGGAAGAEAAAAASSSSSSAAAAASENDSN